jgi:hypothetical protein
MPSHAVGLSLTFVARASGRFRFSVEIEVNARRGRAE